jgi:hypothetical protein
VPVGDIIARLDALPGDPIVPGRIAPWAAELKVKRPEGFIGQLARTKLGLPEAAPVVPAPVVQEAPPPAPAPKPPALPAPAENGKVYAGFRQIRAWAGFYGQPYDGGNIDRLNKFRMAKGLPPVVQDDTAEEAA